MATPTQYPTSLAAVAAALDEARAGTVTRIGQSAGGRPIPAISYGPLEAVPHAANLSAALAARQPAAFFGAEQRARPVALITSAVHGAEMESIAGVLNLIHVLEHGEDLQGQRWPRLVAAAARLRLVIVPCLNPDGRARIPSADPTRWSDAEFEQYRHGLNQDGSPITWPACNVPHPRVPERDGFLGGYFNDRGVNPQHGVFLSPDLAPETHAALALMGAETPDLVLDLHSCGPGPFFIIGHGALPDSYHQRAHYLNGFFRKALSDRLGIHREWGWGGAREITPLDLNSAAYHICGALPMVFEGANGSQEGFRYSPVEIVDMYLVMFEAILSAGAREGFRPDVV